MRILFANKGSENLGIEYLSSALKREGHKTDLYFDMALFNDDNIVIPQLARHFDSKKEFKNKIKKFKPDIICFSCLTPHFHWVKEMSKIAKELNLPVVVGGFHPTIMPDDVISVPSIDIICIGEGELALVELCEKMDKGKKYSDTRNFWFKAGNKLIKNEVRPLIQDLSTLPFPDKELYAKYGFCDSFYRIISGRGCPFNCSFCHNPVVRKIYKNKGPFVRKRSIKNVIEELKQATEKYKFKRIFFNDDLFTVNKNWVSEFCKEYKKTINIPFWCIGRADTISKKIATDLKRAGCNGIDIGVEHGNDAFRNTIVNKNLERKKIIASHKALKKQGIKIHSNFMFGFPEENEELMIDTIKMIKLLKPNFVRTHIFRPFPKTELTEYAVKKGIYGKGTTTSEDPGYVNLKVSNKDRKLIMNYNSLAFLSPYLPLGMFKQLVHVCPTQVSILRRVYTYIKKEQNKADTDPKFRWYIQAISKKV